MTLEEFIAVFRSDTRDNNTPYLWSDADIVRFTNEALNELALPEHQGGAAYFPDRTTWIGLSVAADDPVILDAAATAQPSLAPIIEIQLARLQGVARPLDVLTVEEYQDTLLYEDYGIQTTADSLAWQDSTGVPRAILTDYVEKGLRLAPIPTIAYSLDLWALRTPLLDLQVPSTVGSQDWKLDIGQDLLFGGLEVAQDERTLLHGVKAFAYNHVDDADTYREDLSDTFRAKFDDGISKIAKRLRRKRSPARSVRPNSDYF